jgi:uncharacterized membrane protein
MRAPTGVEKLLLTVPARRRLVVVVVVGALVGTFVAWFVPVLSAALIAWIAGAATFLVWVWGTLQAFDADATRAFATREDDSRVSAQFLLLTACTVSLVGVGIELAEAGGTGDPEKVALTTVAALTVVLSWAVVHVVFALRYAHLYYTEPVGGIDFKNPALPDYRDFLYVAFTIGMTFQVADTDVQDRVVRHTVTRHALLSYLFGAVILALTVNIAATLLQS